MVVVLVITLSTVALPVADGVLVTVPEVVSTVAVVVVGAVAATTPAVATVEANPCCSNNIFLAYASE